MNEKTISAKGILNSPTAPQHYTLKRYFPSKELAPFVEHYWVVRWNLPEGQHYDAEILPSPNVNIAITETDSTITGVMTGKFSSTLSGRGTVLGIKFLPGGFYPFYRRPVERLTNQVVSLKTIFPARPVKNIVAQLDAADVVLVDLTEKLLLAKKPQPDEVITTIGKIIDQVKQDHTISQVQSVGELYGASERTLQYAFKNYVGIGLKWTISRYRLQDVADAIERHRKDWTVIAQQYGFADQSHFIREFKKVLGETPAQYSKRIHDAPQDA